ncbi:MAG: PadR family transcriptional regulator [Chloroflexi bacterium]|nr:MAG: PadR family transcriptional regulator [Chloroflexota bacterium]
MSPKRRAPLTTEHALLGFLLDRPMHGYEIYQHLMEPSGLGLVWHIKQSRMYAMLARLEQAGYLSARVEPQDNYPPRKVFHLTDAGRAVFLVWVRQPAPHGRSMRLEFLTRLYFARRLGPDVVHGLLAAQQTACRQWLDNLHRQIAALPDPHSFEALVYRFRQGQIEAMVDWLTEIGD